MANFTLPTVNINFHAGSAVGITVAYVVIFLFGFFGNICIIYIIVASRKKMKSTFNFLIVNMAVGDLFVCLFLIPFEVSNRIYV